MPVGSDSDIKEDVDLPLDDDCGLGQLKAFIIGKSTSIEVMEVLNATPAVSGIKTYEADKNSHSWIAEIHGYYRITPSPQTTWRVEFVFNFSEYPENVLQSIIIDINPHMTLGDAIALCGEPSAVSAYMTEGLDTPKNYWSVYVLWKERGLLVPITVRLESGAALPFIDENLSLGSYVEFMTPGEDSRQPHWQIYHPWQGYQSFDYYDEPRPF